MRVEELVMIRLWSEYEKPGVRTIFIRGKAMKLKRNKTVILFTIVSGLFYSNDLLLSINIIVTMNVAVN